LILILSGLGILIYSAKLQHSVDAAPRLSLKSLATSSPYPRVAIVIPAYNEAENIRECAIAALNSASKDEIELEVWVADDQSQDSTLTIIKSLQQELGDLRLKIFPVPPRPMGELWAGKNWACAQTALLAQGDWLLFIDADVRLKPGAIAAALEFAETEKIDLLSCWPQIICGCWAEWLVQPLIANILAIGFDFVAVNDPQSDSAFATGQFMLFHRTAYEKLGGHQAVASQIVEDVELARLVKSLGMKLGYLLGSEVASVRMYRSWQALWEGWTKNWYLGSQRNLQLTLYMAAALLIVCVVPWLSLGILAGKGWFGGLNPIDWATLIVALLAIGGQYNLRRVQAQTFQIPTNYWWLTGVSGLLVTAIAIASIIKTETGWGWTWRGRALQLPK